MYSFFALQRNVDKDHVKAAIKAQQDHQIDNVCPSLPCTNLVLPL